MTKIYSIKLAMRWKSDIALHSSTVTLLVIQFKSKCVLYSQKMRFIIFSSHSQSNNLLALGQRFPNWAPRDSARGAAKACESCCICRRQVRSVPRNFKMEEYCLEELLVNRLRSTRNNVIYRVTIACSISLTSVKCKFGGNFCPALRR